VNSTKHYPVL
jgi:hypothetical protein